MLVFKYRKTGGAVYLPHLDVLRHTTRTIRRARIPVAYSQGFNPHMLINLSCPIPLGVESVAEYCFVNTDMPSNEFMPAYNAAAVAGMEILECRDVVKNPNVAGISHSAEYEITAENLQSFCDIIRMSVESGKFEVEYVKKGVRSVKDVHDLIVSIKYLPDKISAVLRAGNVNLRADRFIAALAEKTGRPSASFKILKIRHFGEIGGKVIPIDDLIGE